MSCFWPYVCYTTGPMAVHTLSEKHMHRKRRGRDPRISLSHVTGASHNTPGFGHIKWAKYSCDAPGIFPSSQQARGRLQNRCPPCNPLGRHCRSQSLHVAARGHRSMGDNLGTGNSSRAPQIFVTEPSAKKFLKWRHLLTTDQATTRRVART